MYYFFKKRTVLYRFFAKITVFILLLIVIISCDATKRVPEGKYLLTKNNIIVDDKKTSNPEIISYLRQTPNTKVLGIPFSLHIYNFADHNYKNTFKNWLEKNPNKEKKLVNIFSIKQVKAIEKSYKGINSWIIKSGNPPIISDSLKINKSVLSLTKYFQSKGYFNSEVSFKQDKKNNKKTIVDYLVTKNKPYFIDSIATEINSPVLDSLYKRHLNKTYIHSGNQIDYSNFEKEEERLTNLFRNSGVYYFGKNNMEFWIDTLNSSQKIDISLKIHDRLFDNNDSVYIKPYQIRKVTKVNVFTDFSFKDKNKVIQDSATFNGYTFYATDRLKYNPKYLANSIIIQLDGVYKDIERDLTRKHFRELQNFKPSLDIKYDENKDGSLSANIFLSPLKKFSAGFDSEFTTSNNKPFGVLGKFSWLNRNVFKGAEVLELSFQGSFINSALDASESKKSAFLGLNSWEMGSGISLKIPRILFPIKTTKFIPKKMAPKTNIRININTQRNIGLDRQNITGVIDYTWQSSKTTHHKFELLNLQYINNLRVDKYFTRFTKELSKLNDVSQIITPNNESGEVGNVVPENYINQVLFTGNYKNTNLNEFLTVQKVDERKNILTEDFLVPVISYTYKYNSRENFKDNNFLSFMGRFISSGSITTLFVKSPKDGSQKELLGLKIAQYIKPEIEFKKYWGINATSSLIHRTFIGAAFPFGNSDDIPFSRSYRAGGSNDIRAWNTFRLGPGSSVTGRDFNTGSLKLTTNLEYRFKVLNSLHSALFIDAGNIWDITNSKATTNKGKFKGFSSLKEIAIGSGFGIRYDFSFLVFRFDIGFKTYEPYLETTNKWFKNYNFNHAVYNIGINYPF